MSTAGRPLDTHVQVVQYQPDMFRCRFGPSDTIPSWLGIMPGTILEQHIYLSQVVIAKLLGHDAVTCVAEQRIILHESAVS